MTTNNLPQGTVQNTISLLPGHPDLATLLTAELHQAMQHAINSSQSLTALISNRAIDHTWRQERAAT